MSAFSTAGILLRRIEHGDYDLILTFLSRTKGKIPVIAKNAKKSRKRFSGLLEPFTALDLVCRTGRGGGMPILQEASMREPFAGIRGDVMRTAYASYWAELLNGWMEAWRPQESVYHLLYYALGVLDRDQMPADAMSIIFQVRFLTLSGFSPGLHACGACNTALADMPGDAVIFDLEKGGIVCNGCSAGESRTRLRLSKGTVKQLAWIQENDIRTVQRLRLNPSAAREGLSAMEAFVPYHLGRMPRSLKILNQLRQQ